MKNVGYNNMILLDIEMWRIYIFFLVELFFVGINFEVKKKIKLIFYIFGGIRRYGNVSRLVKMEKFYS